MARTLIGPKIRAHRKSRGLTQASLAARLGISASYLNLIENDRRQIAGVLLKRLADELGLPLAGLDGASERRLIDDLAEAARDPLLVPLALDAGGAVADLAARYPRWANALVTLHRACKDRDAAVTALSDRLHQDPRLADAVHALLTQVSSIRAAAEILESDPALDASRRQRFVAIVAQDSRRVSDVSQALAGFFTRANAATRPVTPVDEVDDFLAEHDNHFASLERAADEIRRDLGATADGAGQDLEAGMVERLQRRHEVRLLDVSGDRGDGRRPRSRVATFDAATRTLAMSSDAPEATRRFELARGLLDLEAGAVIGRELDASPALRSPAARRRARRALAAYAAGALLMPYDAFAAAASAARHDVDRIGRQFKASFEQVCHRLATLRRPGAEGVRFGFLRSDAAGHVSKRLALPNLPLPRYGTGCPLWAVYEAFRAPGSMVRQIAEFPGGDRYLMLARADESERVDYRQPRHFLSVMLICDALHADRFVYCDGLDLSAGSSSTPVGQTCRVCPRRDCAARQEDPVIDAGRDWDTGRPDPPV